MKLSIDNKIYEINNYVSPYKRLIGFMFKKNINKVICFPNCKSIHTFFMKENISVIFLDKDKNILKIIKILTKNKIAICKNAKYVIECNTNLLKNNPKIKIIRD